MFIPSPSASFNHSTTLPRNRFMEPLVYGSYPASMRSIVKERLPTFTDVEKELVKGSFDFIGFNYYTTRYAKAVTVDPTAPPTSFGLDLHTDIRGIHLIISYPGMTWDEAENNI